MKKTARLFSVLFIALMFISCGEKLPAPDEFGFFNDMDAAVATAKKGHKNILLYVTISGFDEYSETFTNDVLHSEDYKKTFGKDYVSVLFDFGVEAYKSKNGQAVTDEEKKKLDLYNQQMAKNIALARRLDLQYCPAVFLMNEDGFAFAEEVYSEENLSGFETTENLFALISEYGDDFIIMQELVNATKKGSAVDKVNAINAIYETVESKYVPSMISLYEQVPVIDKKNESGLVSSLYGVYVISRTSDFTAVNDYGSAISFLTQETGKGILEGDDLQYVYFILAELFMDTGSSDYSQIIAYLTKSVEVNPETELAVQIKIMLSQIEELISEQNLPEEN